MEILEERLGPIVVLRPRGDMDLNVLPEFQGRLDALLADGARGVVWDLGEVGMLPSSGVGFLLQAGRRLQAAGGAMALANAGTLARSTLRTLGVTDLFPLHRTVEAAVASIRTRLGDGEDPRRG